MSLVDPRAENCSPLMVQDLFYTVLDCYRPAYDSMARQALACLAQTCRAFSDPALDRLWEKLHSLEPLIRCYAGAGGVVNTIPPTPSQFTVIYRYSYRVRDLFVYGEASLRFLQCISMRPACLLPNLMVLRWDNNSYSPHIPTIFTQRLLSPTLVSLKATFSEADGVTILSFFENLPLLCPHLKSIEFSFSSKLKASAAIQALSRSICHQRALEEVILDAPVEEIALRYLSTLPTLKVLNIGLSETSRLRTHSLLPTEPLFNSVECLEFETSDLSLVTSLLRPYDQVFHTFRLYYRGRLTSEAALTLLNVLSSQSRTKPFQSFTLSAGDFSHLIPVDEMANEAPHHCLSYETLGPLTVFGSLRYLMIEWSEQISLDDDEVVKLARSWPMLQVFNFYWNRGGYAPFPTKFPTLRGLLSLVTLCPNLHTLSLPLDATHVPEVKQAGPCKPTFDCLILPESPIDQAQTLPVAEFLFKYLPCVTMLDARFLRPPGTNVAQIEAYENAWQQVEGHLKEFRRSLSVSDTVGLGDTV